MRELARKSISGNIFIIRITIAWRDLKKIFINLDSRVDFKTNNTLVHFRDLLYFSYVFPHISLQRLSTQSMK